MLLPPKLSIKGQINDFKVLEKRGWFPVYELRMFQTCNTSKHVHTDCLLMMKDTKTLPFYIAKLFFSLIFPKGGKVNRLLSLESSTNEQFFDSNSQTMIGDGKILSRNLV